MTTQTTPTQATTASTRTTYREALRAAIREALLNDERVFLMGEDVGAYGGAHGVSLGLLEEFGPDRIRDAPLSENGFTGAGIGAALGGMRPIVEIMTVNFSLLALDQILNNAAALLHMSGGQCSVPLVIRMTTGAGRQLAAQHSHSLEAWYAHIPGIRVVAPATLADARGMLATALEDPDPVVIFEHGSLYNMEGELAAGAGAVDIERAAVRHHGEDVSIVAYGGTLRTALTLPSSSPPKASRPMSSTCAPCARSMTRRCSPPSSEPIARSSLTRAGVASAWPPRSARASPSRLSTSWTPRRAGLLG